MRVAIALLFVSSTALAAPFERSPAPPRVFEGIRAGMLVTDAKLTSWQADAAYKDAASRARLVKDAGDGAKYYVLVTGDVVSRIGVEAPAKGLLPRLERLWGKPERATNLANEAITSWSAAGWRVDLSCRGELCRLAFHQTLSAAFFGTQPQPPGVLAGLRPGMTRGELAQLSPRHLAPAVPAGPEDVHLTVELAKSGHVQAVNIGGLPATARAVLEKAWGAPPATGSEGPIWFNADRGWRAELHEDLQTLQLTGYVPAVKMLGPGPGIALLAKPVLGALREQIIAAYPMARADGTKLVIELPPSEGGTGRVTATFAMKTQRVSKLAIELPYDSPARRDELLKLMSAKWGTPATRGGTLVYPADKVTIEVADGANRLDLVIALP